MNILNSYITFNLVQITPILHFQGSEEGAGIRGSGLKPRFDKFLARYIEEGCKNNLIQKETKAFDYKVKIINKGKNQGNDKKYIVYKNEKKNIFYGSFFGKLKDGAPSFYEDIEVQFISSKKDMIEKIKKYFPVFLSVSSFGLRKNKGYGYFKLKDDTKDNIITKIEEYQMLENTYINSEDSYKDFGKEKGIGVYSIKINKNNIKGILDEIKRFHQILKSGQNLSRYDDDKRDYIGEYTPSIMLKRNDLDSHVLLEKKRMKNFLEKQGYDISNLKNKKYEYGNEDILEETDKKYFVRGLLGLAPFYQFRNVKEGNKEKTLTFKIDITGVERFASPICYLPFSNEQVIILVDYTKIEEFRRKARKVIFELDKKKKIKIKDMSIPKQEEYSIHKLFKKDGIINKKNRNYGVISDIDFDTRGE